MDSYEKEIGMYFEIKGTPKSSQESYFRRIKAFISFFNERNIVLENITTQDIQKYILYLKNQRNLSAGTINCYISAVRFFWIHSLGKEWDKNRIPRMKREQKMPVIPAREEIFGLLDSIENLKHKAMLHLLFGGGLRVSEVAKLRISDICSKTMRIRVDGAKHGTNRYTILSKKALDILRIYFKTYFKNKSYTTNDWLFPGQNNETHIHIKTIKNTIIRLRNKLGMDTRISAHTFRHAFAVFMLENKVDTVLIKELLGHKSLKTTTSYLHMTSKAMMGIDSPLDLYSGRLSS